MLSIKLSENGGAAPEAVPYMPAGVQEICATVNGEAGRRRVRVDEAACGRLQADLEKMLAAAERGERARPMLMFDHRAGAAAARPLGFEWDPVRGVLLRVEWTAAGRAAVEGGNYAYVSPAFALRRGSEEILGLSGGVEVGSLVNDPAFERNECIAAGRACEGAAVADFEVLEAAFLPPRAGVEMGADVGYNDGVAGEDDGGGNDNRIQYMDSIKKALGLSPDADESAVLAAIAKLKASGAAAGKQVEELKAECEKHQETLKKHKEAAADGFVERLKKQGTIGPKDKERLEAARAMYLADAKNAEVIFSGMNRSSFEDSFTKGAETVAAGRVPEEQLSAEELLLAEMGDI